MISDYSYPDSVIPSSVYTSASLLSSSVPHYRGGDDLEADYPEGYEASPDRTTLTTVGVDGDAYFSQSLLAHNTSYAHPHHQEVNNEKEQSFSNQPEMVPTELEEGRQKSLYDDAHCEKKRADAQYRTMKMKYLRSVAVTSVAASTSGVSPVASVPSSYATQYEQQRFEMIEKVRHDDAVEVPLAVPSSAPASPTTTPAVSVAKSGNGMGLLARLLSERQSAPSSPKSPSPAAGVSFLSTVASKTSIASASSNSSSSISSCDTSSAMRRTSPISIPKRVANGGSDDGVRYRKAYVATRADLEEEERDRFRAMAAMTSSRPVACAPKRAAAAAAATCAGEFTFSDVFAPSVVSRPMAMPTKAPTTTISRCGKSSGRLAVVYAPSVSLSSSAMPLPSSLLDGFLAL